MNKQSSNMGGSWLVFTIPAILASFISIFAAFGAAKMGAARPVVRLLLLPFNFIISNFVGLLIFVAVTFMFGMVRGQLLYPRITDYLDLTLFVVWGRILGWFFNFDVASSAYSIMVPIWHVVLFQIVLWLLIGHRVASATTNMTMAAAGRE